MRIFDEHNTWRKIYNDLKLQTFWRDSLGADEIYQLVTSVAGELSQFVSNHDVVSNQDVVNLNEDD
jgi:hypothetical protein